MASRPSVASDLVERGHEPEMTRAIARALVCPENLILIDYVTESRLTSMAMIALLCFFLTLFGRLEAENEIFP